jgi:hypothetical protein
MPDGGYLASLAARYLAKLRWSDVGKVLRSLGPNGLRKVGRGSLVFSGLVFAYDVGVKTLRDGNSLPRAVFEAGVGLAFSQVGVAGGCLAGLLAGPVGCIAVGFVGGIGGGAAGDLAGDLLADRIWEPD